VLIQGLDVPMVANKLAPILDEKPGTKEMEEPAVKNTFAPEGTFIVLLAAGADID